MERLDEETWLFRGIADHRDARAALLRSHLAAVIGCSPAEVALGRAPGGRPVLLAPAAGLWFSLGGRDGLVAIATSRRGPVGIDVETLESGRDAMAVARALFSPAEAEWLERLSPTGRDEGFCRLWTAKEAVLKALGRGIAGGVARPDFAGPLGTPMVSFPDRTGIEIDDADHTVVWYTTTVDHAFVVVARSDAAGEGPPGPS